MSTTWRDGWHGLPRGARPGLVIAAGLVCLVAVLAVRYRADGAGLSFDDAARPGSYLAVFMLVALDAVVPIFPGETTLNAAATVAAQGRLSLGPIMLAGALGAVVGDSALFLLARRYSRRFEKQLGQARADDRVQEAVRLLDSSAPVLIIGGRYLPGMRFVVNATMGLSDIAYPRFLLWSAIGGTLWSVYTCGLAYAIGIALGDFPLASFVISGLVTTVALAAVFLVVRRQRRRAPSH